MQKVLFKTTGSVWSLALAGGLASGHGAAITATTGRCGVGSAGGIVAMRPLIIHASSKVSADRSRRVLHIEYSDRIRIEEGLELAVA